MVKRDKLEIIRDILRIIKDNHGHIKMTPLLRKSNLSSKRFADYRAELLRRELIQEIEERKLGKQILITPKGMEFLEKYRTIVNFVNEFDL
jgi:predicted transcriptional regulator